MLKDYNLCNQNSVFIYPTDTVWGIGSSIYSKIGAFKVAEIKRIKHDKPVTILFDSIRLLRDYCNLPLTDQWLKKFFSLHTSLAIPISFFCRPIPEWIVFSSPIIVVRVLENELIHSIVSSVGPITTTSLNISGNLAILKKEDAFEFFLKNCSDSIFVLDRINSKHIMQGVSSTIIKWEREHVFTVMRSGSNEKKIRKYLGI